MDASEVILLFVETSGRYDLVTKDEYGEMTPSARAYHYLNAAQRWLDRELGCPKEDAWLIKTLAAGETLIEFSLARYVKNVYVQDPDDEDVKTSLPWKPAWFDIETDLEADDWPLKGIELEVDDEEDRTIWIHAAWKSPALDEEDSISFWTVEHPELLVRAMQVQTEIDMRNTQGVADFAEPLRHDLEQIWRDVVAEEMSGPPEQWRMR